MNYIFNSEKIQKLLSDFYLSTDIAVTFYDSNMNMVATSPVHSQYCNCIRQKKECLSKCNLSNLAHMKQAGKIKQTVSYTCHAGLMETIIPVFYEETLIGFMQIGQFRDQEKIYSSIDKVSLSAKNYSLDSQKLLSLYDTLPVLSTKKLEAVKQIMLILIKSFWDDSLIRHNRSMLSVKIEQFIVERLKEKLSVEMLCNQFFLSKNALYRLFASEFGTTVGNFILSKRVSLAIDMLKESSLPVTVISSECGFSEYNYFIRAFKKQTGVTPLQFRKNK